MQAPGVHLNAVPEVHLNAVPEVHLNASIGGAFECSTRGVQVFMYTLLSLACYKLHCTIVFETNHILMELTASLIFFFSVFIHSNFSYNYVIRELTNFTIMP